MQINLEPNKSNLVWFFFLLFNSINGQSNLVFNPSFETLDTCVVSQPATNPIPYCGWYSFSSADIFSDCKLSSWYVPNNRLGFQYPHTGNNYAGVQTLTYTGGDYRDYITGYLKDSLKSNKKHCVSFYVSLVDT